MMATKMAMPNNQKATYFWLCGVALADKRAETAGI
jgi:hypothetical protein